MRKPPLKQQLINALKFSEWPGSLGPKSPART